MSDLIQRAADLDREWRLRPCPQCGQPTPRADATCGACGVAHVDADEMVALVEGVEGAADLLGWSGASQTEEDLAYHPAAVMAHEQLFRDRAAELGVDLATAALHWAEGLADADWLDRARRGAAPETPTTRLVGRGASELSERAIRDAEVAERRVRLVRAGLWTVHIVALLLIGAGVVKLLL